MFGALAHRLRGHSVIAGVSVRRFGVFWPRAWYCETDETWFG